MLFPAWLLKRRSVLRFLQFVPVSVRVLKCGGSAEATVCITPRCASHSILLKVRAGPLRLPHLPFMVLRPGSAVVRGCTAVLLQILSRRMEMLLSVRTKRLAQLSQYWCNRVARQGQQKRTEGLSAEEISGLSQCKRGSYRTSNFYDKKSRIEKRQGLNNSFVAERVWYPI